MSKPIRKLFFLLAVLMPTAVCFAQDIILRKNGSMIYCTIKAVDSLAIKYTVPRIKGNLMIRMMDVQSDTVNSRQQTSNEEKPAVIETPIADISLRGGYSKPIGEFADLSTDLTAGLALPGYWFRPAVRFFLNNNLGLGISYNLQNHRMSTASIRRHYELQFPGVTFEVEAGSWKCRGVFIDAVFQSSINRKKDLLFEAGLSAGMPKYTIPEMTITGSAFGNVATLTFNEGVASAVSLIGSLALKKIVSPGVAVAVFCEYFSGHPEFKNLTWSNSAGMSGSDNYKQKVAVINPGLSLQFLIQKQKAGK